MSTALVKVSEAVKLKHTSEIATTLRCAQGNGSSAGGDGLQTDPLLCGAEAVAETSDMQVGSVIGW